MITADSVDKEEGYRCHFPTIDFKFQNVGSATAVLWQFAIDVVAIEIDPTPVLEFKHSVVGESLEIRAANEGWGAATNCEIVLKEPGLCSVLTDFAPTYVGTIDSGQELLVLTLTPRKQSEQEFALLQDRLNEEQFQKYRARWTIYRNGKEVTLEDEWRKEWHDRIEAAQNQVDQYLVSTTRSRAVGHAVRLEGLDVSFRYDLASKRTDWIAAGVKPSKEGDLYLTPTGFLFVPHHPAYGPLDSDVAYVAIVDSSKGPREMKYPFSRQIPPGEAERFHILIASDRSCFLTVQFKFYVDKEIVESEKIALEIWNPRNSRWHLNYKDGGKVVRNAEHMLNFMKKRCPICGKRISPDFRKCPSCHTSMREIEKVGFIE